MTTTGAGDELARLEQRLVELVSCLERDSLPGAAVLEASFARVEEALADVRSVQAGLQAGAAAGSWERCRRLHALALGLTERRREELADQRRACGRLRERLGQARERTRAGGSCDLAA